MFTAELTNEFLSRVETIKKAYIQETYEKIGQLQQNIDSKYTIIRQAIGMIFKDDKRVHRLFKLCDI